jgi:hypothetical protein
MYFSGSERVLARLAVGNKALFCLNLWGDFNSVRSVTESLRSRVCIQRFFGVARRRFLSDGERTREGKLQTN